ncbi:MAG TPA: lysylphosphatidylglycerol synthase domain-containing protein, partial [Thermodesulfobacteriota bacterium]|nr:lysylphosphatidylglycerol synthase domain-containing protein [Thermodesulfobacteriota bacterium]
RFYFYQSKGKSKKNIVVALYLETVTMMAAAAILFLAVLMVHRELGLFSWDGGWLVLLCLLGFALLHPSILQKTLNWVLLKWKREPVSLSISYSQILWILCICILSWMVGGIGFYLFVTSVHPVLPHYILFLTGALAASSMLGLMAIFAPSGLGVREGALVYLLSFLMAPPIAVILSVLTRIWMTLIEIGMIGVIYLFRKFKGKP